MAVRHAAYFDFKAVTSANKLLSPEVQKKAWNGYGYEFVYRYEQVKPEVTWRQLLGLAEELTEHARQAAENRAAR